MYKYLESIQTTKTQNNENKDSQQQAPRESL